MIQGVLQEQSGYQSEAAVPLLTKGFFLVVDTAAVSMAWDSLLIHSHKDTVVITGIFIEHLGTDNVFYHFQ